MNPACFDQRLHRAPTVTANPMSGPSRFIGSLRSRFTTQWMRQAPAVLILYSNQGAPTIEMDRLGRGKRNES